MFKNSITTNMKPNSWERLITAGAIVVCAFFVLYYGLIQRETLDESRFSVVIMNIERGIRDNDFLWPRTSFEVVWREEDYLSRALVSREDFLTISIAAIHEEGQALTIDVSLDGYSSHGTIDYCDKRGNLVETRVVEMIPSLSLDAQFPFKDGALYARGGRVAVQFRNTQNADEPFVVSVTYAHTLFDKTTQRMTSTFLVNQNGVVALP